MKVRELIEQLQKVNPDLEVVLTTIDDDGGARSFDNIVIDLGWEPSGILSLESNSCCLYDIT